MSQPFVAAKVLRAHHPLLRARIRQCGDLFRFETHVENHSANPGIALRVSCLCPEGHNIARRRESFWLEPYMGRYDLLVIGVDQAPAEDTTEDPSPAGAEGTTDEASVTPLTVATAA